MLKVVQYLQSGKTLADLESEFGIASYPVNGKVALNYTIESTSSLELVQECRGLVLRDSTWEVVSFPMKRFFNHGEGAEAPIDWATAAVEEKLDGTMCNVYFDHMRNDWCVGTRKRAEANVETLNDSYTAYDLVDKAAVLLGNESFPALMNNVDKYNTYVFELTSPFNQVICKYDTIELTLLAVRDLSTFKEKDPKPFAAQLGIKTPHVFSVNNFDDLLKFVNEFNPLEREGCIVKDANFNRVKVKNAMYHFANAATDTIGKSWKRVAEAIVSGKSDDLIPIVPEYMVERLNKMKEGITNIMAIAKADYAEICHIDNMKEYAEYAKTKLWPDALFALKRGKAKNLEEYIEGMQSDRIVELVERANPGLLN